MATKRKKKQTLKEFKAWLQGVEELQPASWSPNKEQWELIRDKINSIAEEKKIVEKIVQPQQQVRQVYQNAPAPMMQPAPQVGGIVPSNVTMTPAAQQMLNPAGDAAITPDIDTSDGPVASSFA